VAKRKNRTVETKEIKKGFDWTLNIKASKKRVHFAPVTTNEGDERKQKNKRACRGNFKPEY